jgi:hypothetical protein
MALEAPDSPAVEGQAGLWHRATEHPVDLLLVRLERGDVGGACERRSWSSTAAPSSIGPFAPGTDICSVIRRSAWTCWCE